MVCSGEHTNEFAILLGSFLLDNRNAVAGRIHDYILNINVIKFIELKRSAYSIGRDGCISIILTVIVMILIFLLGTRESPSWCSILRDTMFGMRSWRPCNDIRNEDFINPWSSWDIASILSLLTLVAKHGKDTRTVHICMRVSTCNKS